MRSKSKHLLAVTASLTVFSAASSFHVATGAPFWASNNNPRNAPGSSRRSNTSIQRATVINGGATTSKPETTGDASPVYDARSASAFDHYQTDYQRSIDNPTAFWADQAVALLDWERPFDSVSSGSLLHGDVTWFTGGKLNVCYNAVDRHVAAGKGDQTALLWEGDEPDDVQRITYSELQAQVSQIANALKAQGVQKGDVVTLYSEYFLM